MEPACPWARKFLEFAQLSALVYQDKKKTFPVPPGWTPSPNASDVVNDRRTSLYFEVWEDRREETARVAIVFRGTHELKDWWSNTRWFTRFIPTGWDQYAWLQGEIGNVVSRAQQRNPDCRILTTGHSLGGGLAQFAAYTHPDIKHVIAFDSSPVTGFRSVPASQRNCNRQGVTIERVYERGEILAYFRGFIRRVLPLSTANPSITEIRFDLSKGNAIFQHSMARLAERMAVVADHCP